MQHLTSKTIKINSKANKQARMYQKLNSLTQMGDETDAAKLSHENYR